MSVQKIEGNRYMSKSTKRCVLALDQGTTSSRAILFDEKGQPLATKQETFPQHVRSMETGTDGRSRPSGCRT